MSEKVINVSSTKGVTFPGILLTGRVAYSLVFGDESVKIDVAGGKKHIQKNEMKYDEIENVISKKMVGWYQIIFIIATIIITFLGAIPAILLVPVWIWLGLNQKIVVELKGGNKNTFIIRGKKDTEELVNEIESRKNTINV